MEEYINNYNSNKYKEYLDKLEIYYDYKIKILQKIENDKQTEGLSYNETKDKFTLNYNNMFLEIKKPKYKYIFKEIDEIKETKKKLKVDYKDIKYRILHNLNNEADFKKYQEIVDKLIKLDNEVKELTEYYIKINSIQSNLKINNTNAISNFTKELESLFIKINDENDSILTRKYINDYLEIMKERYNLKNNTYKNIDYIITKLPEIKEQNIKVIDKKEEPVVKAKKVKKTNDEIQKQINSKLKKKIKRKLQNTSTKDLNKLEEDIKNKLFKVFKFKSKPECESRAHSADFFTKKPELIEIIKKSPEIEKRLPSNYQGLSKTKICEELYKL
jgi:hypothetical protein|tara:strand:- start:5751 stop:6743 length:993 start_codon:yes stop_codon:yes gene_type:complete